MDNRMKTTALYLDDEPELCLLFKDYLESKGYHVVTFVDENLAIDYCQKHPPDIAFIDYRLKGIIGPFVAEKLSNDIPKVLVTGELYVNEHKMFEMLLSKPFKLSSLLEAISYCLREK